MMICGACDNGINCTVIRDVARNLALGGISVGLYGFQNTARSFSIIFGQSRYSLECCKSYICIC